MGVVCKCDVAYHLHTSMMSCHVTPCIPHCGMQIVRGIFRVFQVGGHCPPTACHKVGGQWGGQWHPKTKSRGALFKKVQKWGEGGTRPSASPLPPTAWTEIYPCFISHLSCSFIFCLSRLFISCLSCLFFAACQACYFPTCHACLFSTGSACQFLPCHACLFPISRLCLFLVCVCFFI